MNTKEAIEKLKWLSEQISPSPIKEAIDTVIAEVEKPKYMADDMEAFAEWTAFMQWIYDHTDKCWFQKHSRETITTAQLREIWEKERGEATE